VRFVGQGDGLPTYCKSACSPAKSGAVAAQLRHHRGRRVGQWRPVVTAAAVAAAVTGQR